MSVNAPNIMLENGLDLRAVVTTGSVLAINDDNDYNDNNTESELIKSKSIDFIGKPVENVNILEKSLATIDDVGFVKKKIIEEGGGLPLNDGCTVFIAFSGYWENDTEPFDIMSLNKPLEVNLNDNGLLPGLLMAVKSMLVGEMSVFLLSYQVMYGEMGIPPRIKPKEKCVFYIKLVRSILTPKNGKINFSEPNMFERVIHEVRLLHSSGLVLSKSHNYAGAISLFCKAVNMLHKCRLADENEEKIQQKTLIKLYTNLAVSYNKVKKPLKACIACNELNALNSLWNNGKMLYQNAKALRMIGEFNSAEKKLKKAMNLCPNTKEMIEELKLIEKQRNSYHHTKLVVKKMIGRDLVSIEFKEEINNLITNFKNDDNMCKFTLPSCLNTAEIAYIKDSCIKENLFFSKRSKSYNKVQNKIDSKEKQNQDKYVLDKEDQNSETNDDVIDSLQNGLHEISI